jgi:hypothetical protein
LVLCLRFLQLSMQVLDAVPNVLHLFHQPASVHCLNILCKKVSKGHPRTGTAALYRPYGP